MGQPITWRNVSNQTPNVAPLFEGANRSFDRALGSLDNIITDRSKRQDANQATRVDNNTQSFLDQLSQYRTPEELQAAQESGAIDTLRQEYGRNIDRGVARNGANDQLNTLRTRETAEIEYQDKAREVAERDIKDQFGQLVNSGDFDGARSLLDSNELANESSMFAQLDTSQRDRVIRGREDTQYNETQNTKRQTKMAANLAMEAINSGEAADVSRAAYAHRLDAEGITGQVALDALTNFDKQHTAINELTTEDRTAHSAVVAEAQREAEIATQEANRVYNLAEQLSPVDPAFGFANPNRSSVGDAVTFLREAGVDDSDLGTDIQKSVDKLKSNKGIDKQYEPYLGDVVAEAVRRVGAVQEWTDTEKDFEISDFDRVLPQVYAEMLASKANYEVLNTAKKARDKAINTAADAVSTKSAQSLAGYKSLYKSYKKLEPKAK
jgi:hypothetical protein